MLFPDPFMFTLRKMMKYFIAYLAIRSGYLLVWEIKLMLKCLSIWSWPFFVFHTLSCYLSIENMSGLLNTVTSSLLGSSNLPSNTALAACAAISASTKILVETWPVNQYTSQYQTAQSQYVKNCPCFPFILRTEVLESSSRDYTRAARPLSSKKRRFSSFHLLLGSPSFGAKLY